MRLTLKKTTLSDLTSEELSGVVGGLPIPTWYDGCITTVYPSIDRVPECWPGDPR